MNDNFDNKTINFIKQLRISENYLFLIEKEQMIKSFEKAISVSPEATKLLISKYKSEIQNDLLMMGVNNEN